MKIHALGRAAKISRNTRTRGGPSGSQVIRAPIRPRCLRRVGGHGPARFYRIFLLGMALCVASPTPVEAELNLPPARTPEVLAYRAHLPAIQQAVEEIQREEHLKAILLGIRVGGEDVVTMAVGDSMSGVPATTAMHFRIGAVAIAYMGSILLQLVDQGQVSLDDSVGKWLPELPNARRVTLRMLINSMSGYPDYVPYEPFIKAFHADVFRAWSPQELIETALKQPLKFEPGAGWSYAHTNFVILGLALERATGQPFERLMRDRIIQPLGLRDTANPRTPAIPEPVLHAYSTERGRNEESTFWNPSWTLAQGAIMTSTLRDMLTSARAIGTGALLSPAAFAQMLAPDTAKFPPWNAHSYYGLGVVAHHGWIAQNPLFHGYGGVMAYLPERQLAIVVLSTKTEQGDPDVNSSTRLFKRLTQILTPEHTVDPDG